MLVWSYFPLDNREKPHSEAGFDYPAWSHTIDAIPIIHGR